VKKKAFFFFIVFILLSNLTPDSFGATVEVSRDSPALALSYQRLSRPQFRLGKRLVHLLKIKAGEQVLDIGCGSGELTAYTAQFVKPKGWVLGIDPSPYRIKLANQKRDKNLSFRIGGSDDLSSLPSNFYDVVYLNYVFHWIFDKKRALEEMFRILKPGGRLGLCTGDKEQHSKNFKILSESIQAVLGSTASKDLVVPYHISKEELHNLVIKSGFVIDSLMVEEKTNYVKSPKEVIEFLEASDFGNFLAGITEEKRQRILSLFKQKLSETMTSQGIPMKYRTLILIGHKPKTVSSKVFFKKRFKELITFL
jgi:ubiquinone/menaquinone biosynthesis C-methylase UbiE